MQIVKDSATRLDILKKPLGLTVIQSIAKKYASAKDFILSDAQATKEILNDEYGHGREALETIKKYSHSDSKIQSLSRVVTLRNY